MTLKVFKIRKLVENTVSDTPDLTEAGYYDLEASMIAHALPNAVSVLGFETDLYPELVGSFSHPID